MQILANILTILDLINWSYRILKFIFKFLKPKLKKIIKKIKIMIKNIKKKND